MIQSIVLNPFRILGLLSGVSSKEEHTKIKKIKMYVDAEQEIPQDYFFQFLGNQKRDLNQIETAISRLNLNEDRVIAALFWFYEGNKITDEPAFDFFKEGNSDDAIAIWEKLASGEITSKNASAYNNLGTYYLSQSKFKKGLRLKLAFLESDYSSKFISQVADETFKISKTDLQLRFLKAFFEDVRKDKTVEVSEILTALNDFEFSAKKTFLEQFIDEPIKAIEEEISKAKNKISANKAAGVVVAKELISNTESSLNLVSSIVGKSAIKYTNIADKLANEILSCGVAYFKHYKESATDPGKSAMDLFKKAKTIAEGSVTKQRIKENIENLQEWIDEKPEREKQKKITTDFDSLLNILQRYENCPETITNARAMVNSSKQHLLNIKNVLGSSDELYLKLSTRIAAQAQSFIIEEVNEAQDNFEYKIAMDRYGTISKLKTVLKNGWEVTNLIGTLDMEYKYKTERFNPNKDALRGLCTQLGVSTSTASSYNGSSSSTTPRPTSTSASQPRQTYTSTSSSTDSGLPGWIKFAGLIIVVLIMSKMCGSSKYSSDSDSKTETETDYSNSIVDSAAAVAAPSYEMQDDSAAVSLYNDYEMIDSAAVSYSEVTDSSTLNSLNGNWYGYGEEHQDNTLWNVKLTIDSYNEDYRIEYPDLNCGGRLVFIREEYGNLIFREKITRGISNCIDGLRAEVKIINSNKVEIYYYDQITGNLNATGYLDRTNY